MTMIKQSQGEVRNLSTLLKQKFARKCLIFFVHKLYISIINIKRTQCEINPLQIVKKIIITQDQDCYIQ